jgi:O-antigen/teichoic acid export membrane protein
MSSSRAPHHDDERSGPDGPPDRCLAAPNVTKRQLMQTQTMMRAAPPEAAQAAPSARDPQRSASGSAPARTAGIDVPSTPHDQPSGSPAGGLFGRGLLYVVVFSFQTIAALLVSPILAHLIGPEEFGRLASAIALHQLLAVFAILGLDQAVVLQRAADGNSRAARGLVAVAFACALTAVGLAWLTAPWWEAALGFSGASHLLAITMLWTVPGAAVYVVLSLLLAEDRLRIFTLVSASSAVGGQILGVLLVLFVERSAVTYAWGNVISYGLAVLIGSLAVRPRPRGLLDTHTTWRAVRLGVPLAVSGLATFVLNAGDRIVVQRLLGAAEVGRYQVAYTMGYVVVLLMVFVSQSWTPRFAVLTERTERVFLQGQARDQLYRLLIPTVIGITLVAPLALRIVAPASFQPETLSLVVFLVAVSAFPVAAGGASGRELVMLRRGRSIAAAACAAAVLNVALNIVLVPIWGIAGAAAATVLAFALSAILQRRLLVATTPWPRTPSRLSALILAASVFSAGSTFLPQTLDWNLGRLVLALACLPWLILELRRARGTR